MASYLTTSLADRPATVSTTNSRSEWNRPPTGSSTAASRSEWNSSETALFGLKKSTSGSVANTADDEKRVVSDTETVVPHQPEKERIYTGWRWLAVCIALYISVFLYGLDNTIVADVQGAIVEQYGQVNKLGWLGIGFPLGSVATILSQGKAYGMFDMKSMYIGGILMFEAGSALCAGAPSMNALIFGRVWAGSGGAGMYLGLLNILTYATSERERPMYIAGAGTMFGVGCVLGPVIGGAFADSGATWRWAFYINLVVCAACAPVYLFVLKPMSLQPNRAVSDKLKDMDWVGVVLNAATYASFVLAFTFGGAEWAWKAGGTIVFIVLSLVFASAYAVQQTYCIFTTPENRLFPLDFLKHRSQLLLFVLTACSGAVFFIPLYYIPVFYQFVHAEGGVDSAVRLLPFLLVAIFALLLNGAMLPVTGYYMPWYLVAGVFQLVGGVVYYKCVDASTSNAAMYGFSVVIAVGGGLAQQASYSVSAVKAGPDRAADAAGFINVAQISGIMFALTISSSVFQNVGFRYLETALAGHGFTTEDVHAVLAGQKSLVFASASSEVQSLAIDAIVKVINEQYILAIAAGALTVACSLFLKRERLIFKTERQ